MLRLRCLGWCERWIDALDLGTRYCPACRKRKEAVEAGLGKRMLQSQASVMDSIASDKEMRFAADAPGKMRKVKRTNR